VTAEADAHRRRIIVGECEAHDIAHDGLRFADGEVALDDAFGGAIGDQQRNRQRPKPARFPRQIA
jgi:hypothetical protein